MQLNSELNQHNNFQRLIFQIKDNVLQSVKKIDEMNSQTLITPQPFSVNDQQRRNDSKKVIETKRDIICQKLQEFKQSHWKIHEETQINSIVRNLRNAVKSQISFPQFQELVVHESKEESLCQKELTYRKRTYMENKFEIHELTTLNINSKEPEAQIVIYRPLEIEERFWYLATFITTSLGSATQQSYDIQVNPISSKKETNTIQKVKVDSEYIIYSKLNAWFRYLYFARINSKMSNLEEMHSFISMLNYIRETMNRLFGQQSSNDTENGCQKCGKVLKLSSIKSEGFLLPYIYFIEPKNTNDINDNNVSSDHQMLHEQCFFKVES